ncbi:MAG: hypothetical protein K6A23_07700 [Butyrivibrio sp.]|nr:hypothetical protein [Butyrivibrio sp.]
MRNKKEYIPVICIGAVTIMVIATVLTWRYMVKLEKKAEIEKAENYIQTGKYEEALEILEDNADSYYAEDLIEYAKAKKAEEDGLTPDVVYSHLKRISGSDGNLAGEMEEMWSAYGYKYNVYMKQKKQADEAAKAREEAKQREAEKKKTESKNTTKKQESSSSSKNKQSSGSSSKKNYNTSPYSKGSYDVDDYDTPEDFADDAWGDEFDDWDEAYEFWEDNY